MFTPVFEKVDGKAFTLGDIIVTDSEGHEYDETIDSSYKNRKISVYKLMTDQCVISASYDYTSKNGKKWDDYASTPLVSGEGIIVYNYNDAPAKFRTSGGVILKPQINIPVGYSIYGNNTPVDMTLGDIKVTDLEGHEYDETIDSSYKNRKLSVYKLMADQCVISMSYDYTSKNGKKWDDYATESLKAGEALIVYNYNDAPCKFVLKDPIPAK